jgi:hypothetical protein
MRLFELLMDRLCDTSLMEMAFQRKQARTHATGLSNQLSLHMIKILMFGKAVQLAHWIKECDVWLHDIQDMTLKNTKKPLGYADLMYLLHEGPLELVEQVQKKMNRLYREYPDHEITEPDAGAIHKQLLDIYSRICLDISQEKFKTVAEYAKLS